MTNDNKTMTNLPIGQITQLTESSQPPRSMASQTVLPQLQQENANLRELLNASMAENVALLQQVAEMQEALSMQIKTFDAMKLNSDRALENWMNTCTGLDKRIDELTKERDEALKQLESIENELQTVDEIAETPTHFVLLGTPGAHNCDQMGCGYSHVLFRVEKKALPGWVALLRWSQTAYKRLGGLMVIGVSMTPDVVTASLLSDAPANVAAEVDPFSAELDATYSIYTDPLIVGVAEGLDCTVDELMEYAVDSVGVPGGETK